MQRETVITPCRRPTWPVRRLALSVLALLFVGCRAADRWTTQSELREFANSHGVSLAECFGLEGNWDSRKLHGLERAHGKNPDRFLLLPGVLRLTPVEAQVIAGWSGSALALPDLEEASVPILELVVSARGKGLYLGGLHQITPDHARALTEWNSQGDLYLTGLRTIATDVAEILATWGTTRVESFLVLDGLKRVSPEVGALLIRGKCWALSLNGLTEIGAPLARAFEEGPRPTLRLNGISSFPAEALPSFERWRVKFLWLDGIEDLTVELAGSVARCESGVLLGGVRELSLEVARILASIEPAPVYLYGVHELSGEVRRHLATHAHHLSFRSGVL
jgi:hypothetical protein